MSRDVTFGTRRAKALWRRHPPYVWALWILALVALSSCPILFSDPQLWPFVFDPELVALLIVVFIQQGRFQLTVLLLSLRNGFSRVRSR
ncbi:MAG TPA: hypothetical protein VHC49_26325 [Mycobacteriales bacterium]|nr:hypothetical protein [Mycobacteriales bacterium]